MIDKNCFLVQLQTLLEISHLENSFGDLNQGNKCTNIKQFDINLFFNTSFLVQYLIYSLVCSFNFLRMVCGRCVSRFNGKVHKQTCKPVYGKRKKINMLLAVLGSVRIGKNCDRGLENAALGLRPRASFLRPRSQFFPIRTSQPANNIYLFH